MLNQAIFTFLSAIRTRRGFLRLIQTNAECPICGCLIWAWFRWRFNQPSGLGFCYKIVYFARAKWVFGWWRLLFLLALMIFFWFVLGVVFRVGWLWIHVTGSIWYFWLWATAYTLLFIRWLCAIFTSAVLFLLLLSGVLPCSSWEWSYSALFWASSRSCPSGPHSLQSGACFFITAPAIFASKMSSPPSSFQTQAHRSATSCYWSVSDGSAATQTSFLLRAAALKPLFRFRNGLSTGFFLSTTASLFFGIQSWGNGLRGWRWFRAVAGWTSWGVYWDLMGLVCYLALWRHHFQRFC